jgi:hypothetical protein
MVKPPFFLIESPRDVCVFKTIEELEQYAEPIDVRSGIYKAFCGDGTRLSLSVKTPQPSQSWIGRFVELIGLDARGECVKASTEITSPTEVEEFAECLRRLIVDVYELPQHSIVGMHLVDLSEKVDELYNGKQPSK